LRLVKLTFGIVAPPAFERASFKKDRRPDSWSIIDRVALDIEDNSCAHG
jgi:hypothetical protein